MLRIAKFLGVMTLAVLGTTRCGQRVCVAGIGDCTFSATSTKETQSGGKLTINADTSDMKSNERRELTITGGAAGTITLTITQGMGEIQKATEANRATYIAPSNPSASGTSVVITARDSLFKDEASDPDKNHWTSIHFMVYP